MSDPFYGLNEEHFTFHLQYKHSGTFANRKDMKNCLTPKNAKMYSPAPVVKMRPHPAAYLH